MRTALLAALVAALPLFGSACRDDLRITVTFDRIGGLKETDAVMWDENRIGEVEEVRYTSQGTYEVAARIEESFRAAATDRARFLVADRRDGPGKILQMIRGEPGGTPLPEGSVIRGSTRPEVWEESLRGGLQGFLDELRRIPESEAFRQLERQLDELAETMQSAGEGVRRRIQREILPQLEKQLEAFKEWLREQGREREADPLERKLEELKRT